MSARTILKHLHQQGRMTDYQFDVINRNLKARPQGEWIKISPANIYECSECHQVVMTSDIKCYLYCHQCGTEMRVKDEICSDRVVITKEAFIEAYNRWIKGVENE